MRRVTFAVRGFRYGYVRGELHSWMLRGRMLEGGKTRDLPDSNVRGNVDIDVKVNGRFQRIDPVLQQPSEEEREFAFSHPCLLICYVYVAEFAVSSLLKSRPRASRSQSNLTLLRRLVDPFLVSRRRAIFPMDSDWLASIECIPLSIAS